MLPTVLIALALVRGSSASQEAADADVDDCAFLTVSRSVTHSLAQAAVERGNRKSGGAHQEAAGGTQVAYVARKLRLEQKMSRLLSAYEREPVELLRLLDKAVDFQTKMADGFDDEAERAKLALLATSIETRGQGCSGQEGPCWSKAHEGHLEQQPAYPWEPLLDQDYIYEANNYLETWMNRTMGNHSSNHSSKKGSSVVEASSFVADCVAVSNGTHSGVGDKCVFGVSQEDEGSHCVYDGGRFGAYGWCYTKDDRSAWGSCLEMCTVRGHPTMIKQNIKQLSGKLKAILAKLHKTAA